MFDFKTALTAFLALFSILNPVTVVPLYADLTRNLDAPARKKLFNTAIFAGFVTLTVLTFTGTWVMQYVFQIHVSELRIAGGIILVVIAVYEIGFSKPNDFTTTPDRVMQMGVVPMAVPLLVGPGSIVTGILILSRDGWLVALIALITNFIIAFVIVRSSVTLARIVGPLGTLVVARVLWIFIAAIAVHFILSGISEAFGIPLPFSAG
ncbi:MAG TPA: MarC family protein [Spirochaetia bacterium]|nr:MarC family protein [Spirochaetia bacterium]